MGPLQVSATVHSDRYPNIELLQQCLRFTFFLFRINEKLSILRERDAHIANLEAEINEIVSKLNLLQNEKGRLVDNENVRTFNSL